MPPSYESLSTEEDTEDKLFIKSEHDYTSYNASKPSAKLTVFAYALLVLTVLFAGTSLITSITAVRIMRTNNAPIDTLPRPNIFVGLPKNPKATRPNVGGEHSHIHPPADGTSIFLPNSMLIY